MEFKIVYGRSGSGKTTYIFNSIREKIKGKNKIYIVVHEQFSFSAETRFILLFLNNFLFQQKIIY